MIRRIAVTGAGGFIGSHLIAALERRAIDVAPVGRGLVDAFGGADVVVHLAGVVSAVRESEYFAGNVDYTRVVASAARDAGARLVHISSLAAAGPADASTPRSEDDPPCPVTPYGRSKLEGERAVQAVDRLRWTILRPGAVYGPGDRALLPLFRLARRGVLPLTGRPGASYTFVHVSDVIRAIEAAIDNEADGETVFVGHPQPVTARDIAEGIRAAVGSRAAIVRVPSLIARLAAAAGDLTGAIRGKPAPLNRWRYVEMMEQGFVCHVDRLRECLGIVAQVGLREGLGRTADWYRREGWL